jgi:hypothetical protein
MSTDHDTDVYLWQTGEDVDCEEEYDGEMVRVMYHSGEAD